ncbi:PTS system cellobiose-specific transporter subunit IIA [Cutibacterium acnes P06A]|nr:PTS system cellobiose-specific transporter subunit IIA [Cutibacterium acnes P06A]
MTSYCGSDSPDGGAVMPEIETAIFTIITSAGEARASLYQALDKHGLARWLRVNSA